MPRTVNKQSPGYLIGQLGSCNNTAPFFTVAYAGTARQLSTTSTTSSQQIHLVIRFTDHSASMKGLRLPWPHLIGRWHEQRRGPAVILTRQHNTAGFCPISDRVHVSGCNTRFHSVWIGEGRMNYDLIRRVRLAQVSEVSKQFFYRPYDNSNWDCLATLYSDICGFEWESRSWSAFGLTCETDVM